MCKIIPACLNLVAATLPLSATAGQSTNFGTLDSNYRNLVGTILLISVLSNDLFAMKDYKSWEWNFIHSLVLLPSWACRLYVTRITNSWPSLLVRLVSASFGPLSHVEYWESGENIDTRILHDQGRAACHCHNVYYMCTFQFAEWINVQFTYWFNDCLVPF